MIPHSNSWGKWKKRCIKPAVNVDREGRALCVKCYNKWLSKVKIHKMIRMFFDPALEMATFDRASRLIRRLEDKGFQTKSLVDYNKRVTFIIQVDIDAYDLVSIHMPNARFYAICNACQTIHFKTEETCNDLFRCACGTYVNKPIKQK